jgi:uncharacterized membrane protein YfcA
MEFEYLIIPAVIAVAILYSSVGHGGGSGYLAVMAFFSVAPNITKPTALTLNIFVSAIAFTLFYKRGYFDWKTFFPFAAASVPFAFVGGMIELPILYYKFILGLVLLFAAVRLAWKFDKNGDGETARQNILLALLIGGLIGLTSGLIGVGGGIFLTPILFLTKWTTPQKAAGISALFILVNSVSGLAGNYQNIPNLPRGVMLWIAAAVIGGIVGSTLGSRYFNSLWLRRVLALVLVVGGIKLFLV